MDNKHYQSISEQFNISGLTDKEVADSARRRGKNDHDTRSESGLLSALKSVISEPMIILLFVASAVYFFTGHVDDGLFMVAAIIFVATISLYQESRSEKALKKLKEFTQPICKVIRNNMPMEVKTEDLVFGDFIIIEEGTSVPADALIVHSNDFSVNESLLTGESMVVYKDSSDENRQIYQGTYVTGGLAIAEINAIGSQTRMFQIGQQVDDIALEKTPLEKQINDFIKKMVIVGVMFFLIILGVHYLNTKDFSDSLLKALTLAMSILPEEIPVAFATFMALGSWRLMKLGIVVKKMKTVETLGSATVICTDKTGTITQNRMTLVNLYIHKTREILTPSSSPSSDELDLINAAMWASEPIPFDPMEVSLHAAYQKINNRDARPEFQMIHEYPLGGKPPMMTHIFQNAEGVRIIAAKGAPEAFLALSQLSGEEIDHIKTSISQMASRGFRLLGVGLGEISGDQFPEKQQEIHFEFLGLIAFYDPPKENIKTVLHQLYNAHIDVKIITGDNETTTMAIAKEVGLKRADKKMSGEELMALTDDELGKQVLDTQLFTRMFPEAKLRIINMLKAQKQIVAMTGDGVNDGPALKAAHIGVAMGKRGTEIAKEAASLILLDDDLAGMVDAVAAGRKIYTNLKKAIQYIISIHIPIILTVLIPVVMGWKYTSIFFPIHVIFFELIMGPTCSIIYENEPMEKDTMTRPPRQITQTFFNIRELTTSIVQGLVITAGVLLMYGYAVQSGYSETMTRTMVFTVLISANIFLTLVNRSFYFSMLDTLRYKNPLVPLIIFVSVAITALILFYPPLRHIFDLEVLPIEILGLCILTGAASAIWYEVVKLYKRWKYKSEDLNPVLS